MFMKLNKIINDIVSSKIIKLQTNIKMFEIKYNIWLNTEIALRVTK